jgi:hypothetical protein
MLGAIDSGRMSETIWVYGYHGTSMERASAIVEAGFTPNTVRLSRVSTLISVRVGGLWLYSCGFNRHLTLNRTVLEQLGQIVQGKSGQPLYQSSGGKRVNLRDLSLNRRVR